MDWFWSKMGLQQSVRTDHVEFQYCGLVVTRMACISRAEPIENLRLRNAAILLPSSEATSEVSAINEPGLSGIAAGDSLPLPSWSPGVC